MTASEKFPIICLMGPTASGKTALAVEIVRHFPCEIISVDSAMVYRGMDIGTAKPSADILKIAPHRLINILDPKEAYSAGQFRIDALREIDDIISKNKIPLLVGGTMMYFRVLQQGLASLPKADPIFRQRLQKQAEREGWETLHAYLATIDPEAAHRINPHDSQRIQRALEVYALTGKPMTAWQVEGTNALNPYPFCNIGLLPENRSILHERIAQRFRQMLEMGLVDECKKLFDRGDLSPTLPSIRSVGYRQVWAYLANEIQYEEMCEQAIAATRQLAKRQITWLRSWPTIELFSAESATIFNQITQLLKKI